MMGKTKGTIGDKDRGIINNNNLLAPYPYKDSTECANKEVYLNGCQKEFNWPDADYQLLSWYFDHLGVNQFEIEWADQTEANRKKEPDSRYLTFRHRLALAINKVHPGGLK